MAERRCYPYPLYDGCFGTTTVDVPAPPSAPTIYKKSVLVVATVRFTYPLCLPYCWYLPSEPLVQQVPPMALHLS